VRYHLDYCIAGVLLSFQSMAGNVKPTGTRVAVDTEPPRVWYQP